MVNLKAAFLYKSAPESPTTPPAPPPMPSDGLGQVKSPTRPPLRNLFSSQSSVGSLSLAESNVLEELELVLKGANKPLRSYEIHYRTPEVFIDQQSDANAVQEWLKMKGFSEGLCKKLQGTTGAQLLQLSKSDLGRTVGHEEDWRLYSQLTLQRNMATKFKTARTAELENLLQKFRQKAEEDNEDTSATDGNDSSTSSESKWLHDLAKK